MLESPSQWCSKSYPLLRHSFGLLSPSQRIGKGGDYEFKRINTSRKTDLLSTKCSRVIEKILSTTGALSIIFSLNAEMLSIISLYI